MQLLRLIVVFLLSAQVSATTIDTVAGTGKPENNGDKGTATERNVGDPFGVEIGPDDALYITEVRNHRVRRVDLRSGMISTVAGSGRQGYSGDGQSATKATLNEPYEVRFDDLGNMYFVEMKNHLIRRVDAATGTITTIAGTGRAGFGGDGGPAIEAEFRQPHSIALDGHGNLFVADIGNHRIRRIDLHSGLIDTIAGTGERTMPTDGQKARGKPLIGPRALAIDGQTMWIALREGHSIWRMDLAQGTLHHVAGSGQQGYRDGAAREAMFDGPKGIAVGPDGELYVVDTENHVIRQVDPDSGQVSTIAGSRQQGSSGDGGPARQAQLSRPHGICVGGDGELFIGDTLNHRVRRVRP